jgi:hypothetical protein
MSTMRMPGFTGEASVYRTSQQYLMTEAPAQACGAIQPASFLDRRCYAKCRLTCDCSNFPGPKGVCMRLCNAECAADCTFG